MNIKKLLFLCPLLFFTKAYADYGIIQDPEGQVNVRESDSLKAKVIDKLNNGQVVSCRFDSDNTSFCDAVFDVNGRLNSGFVHQSRVNFFNGFQKWNLTQKTKYMATYIFAKNRVTIQVMPAKFNESDFKKEYSKEHGYYVYTTYKNKPFLGTDGDLPNDDGMYQLREIQVTYNGQTTIIPQHNLEQYFFPNTPLAQGGLQDYEMAEIYSKGDDLYILNALNIGGAAHYNLMLHIRGGKLIKQSAWSE